MKKTFFILLSIFLFIGCNSAGSKKESLTDKWPESVKMAGTAVRIDSLAGNQIPPGGKNVPLVGFALVAKQSGVALKTVKFDQVGTIRDADIERVKLYVDNGNGVFDLTKDLLLVTGQVNGNVCEFNVDHPLYSQPQTFFITADLSMQASGNISLRFAEGSFGTTDVVGVAGKYPFTFNAGIVAESSSVSLAKETPSAKPKAFSSTDSKGIISDLEKSKSVKMQENEFLAQKYYETGLKLFKEFKYNQAVDEAERALQLDPNHQEAKKLLSEIQVILGSRPAEIKVVKQFLQSQLAVKIQETEIVVRNHFLNGEKLVAEKKYTEAQTEFEAVVNKLKYIPYEIGLTDYLVKSQERLKQIKDLITREEEVAMQQRRAAAALIAQEEELKRQQEFNEKLKTLFKEALVFFEQKRFVETERLAGTILELAPYFQAAAELKKEAVRARHYDVSEKYMQLRAERLRELYDEFKETVIPYADDTIVRYDKEAWAIASKRQPTGTVGTGKAEEDVDILEIKRKLKTIKHDFKLDGTVSLYDVTNFLQQQYKIPIIYSSDVRSEGVPNEQKSLTLVGLPLEVGLRNLLELYNLSYTFNRDFKCLWITRLTALEEELEWRVHNVEDLVRPIPEFAGPNIELALTPGGAPGWTAPQGPEAPPIAFTRDDVIEMIKKNTGKDRRGASTWEDSATGITIKGIGDSNKLMVVHTSPVQSEIVDFLQVLRSFRSTMIAIESTFLATTDDNLEDFGIQLRDLTSPTNPILDATPPLQGSSGLDPGGNRDLRFRTAYTFRDSNGAVETALPPSDIGGLGLQFTVLRRNRLNLLLNALEKTGKGAILDSPKIVALNGQRVNISFLKQRQYVQDADIQSGAIAYEPIINTFSTGVVLDVKPVMSYDRKYITVHVFPTLLELLDTRSLRLQYEYLPLGIVTQVTLEMPWLRLQRCRTSAVIPDKGALVLGGLKTVYDRDITASTPFLDKIPVIQTFFRRKIKSEEKKHQIIVVRAEIIELPEIEQTIQ